VVTSEKSFGAGFAGGYGTPPVMRKAHQHPEVELNYFIGGGIVYLMRGRLVRVPAGRFSLFWAAAPHQSVKVDAKNFYWFTLPLSWVLHWNLPSNITQRILDGGLHIDDPLPDDEIACARWCSDLRSGIESLRYAAQLELRARLLRMACSPSNRSRKPRPATADAPQRVEKIATFITKNYLQHISARQIADAAGLHPNYAATLFREHCGMTPFDYVIMHRAYHAHQLLATTDRKIIDIAFDSGFRSLARFYASFERVFHCTPSDIRAARRKVLA
jgi:AraC-like DNA-binding protein